MCRGGLPAVSRALVNARVSSYPHPQSKGGTYVYVQRRGQYMDAGRQAVGRYSGNTVLALAKERFLGESSEGSGRGGGVTGRRVERRRKETEGVYMCRQVRFLPWPSWAAVDFCVAQQQYSVPGILFGEGEKERREKRLGLDGCRLTGSDLNTDGEGRKGFMNFLSVINARVSFSGGGKRRGGWFSA